MRAFPFCGVWETEDRDSNAVFEITMKDGQPSVRAFSKRDKEEFVVSNVSLRDETLSFETCVPSNNYRAKHLLRILSDGKMEQELTLIERWLKVGEA